MRVVVVAPTDFESFPVGGTLTFLREFISVAGMQGRVSLRLVGWTSNTTPANRGGELRLGGSAYEFTSIGARPRYSAVPDRIAFLLRLRQWARQQTLTDAESMYYCHSPEAVLGLSRVRSGLGVVLHLHGSRTAVGQSRFALGRVPTIMAAYQATILNPALRMADAVMTTIPPAEHDQLARAAHVKAGVPVCSIPAMVGPAFVPGASRVADDAIRLVCVGRLETIKGINLILYAIQDLLARRQDVRLHVVGAGSQAQSLQDTAKRLGVAGHVRWEGECSRERVVRILQECDVYVSGSYHEGFSLALLESLACGMPAVVTAVGNAAQIVQNGANGFVINSRDPSEFAKSIVEAARRRGEMGQAAAASVEVFRSARVVPQMLARFRDVQRRRAFEACGA